MGSFRRRDISLHTRKKYSVFGFDKPALHLHKREGCEPILPASQDRLFSCFISSSCTHKPKFILFPVAIAWIAFTYYTKFYFRVSSTFKHRFISISFSLQAPIIEMVLLRFAISSHSDWEAPSPSLVCNLQNISLQRPSPFNPIYSEEQGICNRSGAVKDFCISNSPFCISPCSVDRLLITSD